MSRDQGNNLPSELAAIEARLREERQVASGVELDELKVRAMRQARQARPGTRLKGQLMKSRLALLTMIVAGLMMSTTGVGLAIQGSSGEGSAGKAAYPKPLSQVQGGNQDTLGADQGGNGDTGTSNGSAPSNDQGSQQVAATSGKSGGLPFTGFLAIPLMIGGVALLGSGTVLRRRARD